MTHLRSYTTDSPPLSRDSRALEHPVTLDPTRSRIDIVFPALPPTLDGIGDHTVHLAHALSPSKAIRILTAERAPNPVPGVTVETAFSLDRRRGIFDLVDVVRRDPPEWLLLQFNQFSYGKWGLNPFLPLAVRSIRRSCPTTRIALMAHEDFVPPTSWKFAVMTLWQRAQFLALGRLADIIFFPIQPWVDRYASWFQGTPVKHLPVGSNIPRRDISRLDARHKLGIAPEAFVLGLFGAINAGRLTEFIRRAAARLEQEADKLVVLYVGKDGEKLKTVLSPLPIFDAGPRPAPEVSLCLSAMDLHLTPYVDGVSTRRGAFMAGLQHGVPTLATNGPLTDPALAAEGGTAFDLVSVDNEEAFDRHALSLYRDPQRRRELGATGKTLYESRYSWDHIASHFLATLSEVCQ